MSGVDWDRVREAFERALAVGPAERAAVLTEMCGSDAGLRSEVESLLRSDAEAAGFMNRSLAESVAGPGESRGQRFGPYAIDKRIGMGGMGVVYRAHRADGAYDQEVVVKLLRGHAIDGEMHRRFERERQVLASLRHPNIARLLDGGMGDGGQPFLVMEYVRGDDILTHCRSRGLGLAERLELFDAVCAGVQHAHASLVVHRDLKPAHVVIDEDGQPRLLDFGIATILREEAAGDVATQTAEHRLTPQYASPEQVRGESVTTATDVYALGLILYELLAGEPPYRVASGTTDADRRLICETAPVPPSRSVGDVRLSRRLRGELDTIVLTAIRKEPERRYASAEALREDLRRYREGLPIASRPDTVGYRVGKFVSRNRLLVGAVATVMVVLAGGVVGTTWQAGVARLHAKDAERALAASERVQRFLRSVLTAPDPREGEQGLTMREALDLGRERIEEELGDDAGVESMVREAIGATYRTLGAHEQAEAQLVRAYELAGAAFGDDDPARASIAHELAVLRYDQGSFAEAERLARQSLEARLAAFGPENNQTLEAENLLALTVEQQGRPEEALEHLAHVMSARERLLGADDPSTLEASNNYANLLTALERYDEALPLMERVYQGQARVLGESHPDTLITANDMGSILGRLERWEEALGWQQIALAGLESKFPPGTIDVAIPRLNVARSFARLGREAEAVDLQTLALTDATPALGEDHYVVAVLRMDRGKNLVSLGRIEEGRADLEAALPVLEGTFGADHAFTRDAAGALAELESLGEASSTNG